MDDAQELEAIERTAAEDGVGCDGADRENATPAVAEVESPPPAKSEFCADPEAFLSLLYQPGDVWELRALHCPVFPGANNKRTASGYFDRPAPAAKWARILDTTRKPPGVYCTLNPVLHDLLGRSHNRINDDAVNTTADEQIVCRRWIVLDIEPVRPAGVSATNAETRAAVNLAKQIRDELAGSGWPEPLRGMSGNGVYLLYRVDLPNDDDATDLVKRVLHGLANRFDNTTAKIDRSTFNASRIIKVFGTTARKGDDFRGTDTVPARPHRVACFRPPDGELLPMPVELLHAVAAKPEEMRPPTHGANENDSYVMDGDRVSRSRGKQATTMTNDWKAARSEILERLDIAREAEHLGVRFSAAGPNAGGWRECHAIGREDAKPSAAVNVASRNGPLGMYTDLGTGEKLPFFDLAARLQPGRFRDWYAAMEHYAEQTGVALPKGRAARKEEDPESLLDHVQFLDDKLASTAMLIGQWTKAKKGVTEDAVRAAGGRVGLWPARAPEEAKKNVVTFPAYRPDDWTRPTAIILYRTDGRLFPPGPDGYPPERKTHLIRDSVDSLIVVGGQAALAAADVVWLCEGPTDALALSGHLPAGHVAVTNTHGAGSFADELVPAFAGKRLRIVGDADTAGVDGAKLRASKLVPVAAETRIVTLPYEVQEKHGKDLRDYLAEGHTWEELAQLADAAPVLTAADVPRPPPPSPSTRGRGKKSKQPEARISNAEVIRHEKDERGSEDGKSSVEVLPLIMPRILEKIRQETGNWPRRVDQTLFVHEANEVSWFTKSAELFGFLQSRTGIVDWHTGDEFVTKEELFAEMKRTAIRYLAIEEFPHHPPIAQHYYTHDEVGDGDGKALAGLLDRFKPATDIDRDLIQAALMTLFWGGAGGTRPAFVITADLGRGKGKSKTAEMLGRITGGAIDFSHNEDIEMIKKRLLSSGASGRRMALIDNVKSLRFSWGELEALITAPSVSGWRLYAGEGTCPNTFTWFLTLNGAAFSKDMAQRAVIIKIGEPTRSGTWEDDTKAYIDTNRQAIIADVISLLKGPPTPDAQLAKFSRWATWENAVLTRLPDPADAQKVILERQAIVDVEAEEVATVVEHFHQQIQSLGYSERDQVFIPSKVATVWYNIATGEKKSVGSAGRLLKQYCEEGETKGLRPNTCKTYGRGLVWLGSEVDATVPIYTDLLKRLEGKLGYFRDVA